MREKRDIILSDGTACHVVLYVGKCATWYPDLPHCVACQQSAATVPLRQCDARVRGKHDMYCNTYVCEEHVVSLPYGHDLCPQHRTWRPG